MEAELPRSGRARYEQRRPRTFAWPANAQWACGARTLILRAFQNRRGRELSDGANVSVRLRAGGLCLLKRHLESGVS